MGATVLAAVASLILGPVHPPAQPPSVAAAVAASGGAFDRNRNDFDILLTAVQTANLAGPLSDPAANLTVFAPTDRAFIRTAQDLGFAGNDEAGAWQFLVTALTNLGGGDPIPVLTSILLYHVTPERYGVLRLWPFSATDAPIPTLLAGASLRFYNGAVIDAEPDVANPRLATPVNLVTGNGIIHAIDRVLLPVNLPGGLLESEPTPDTIAAIVARSGGVFDDNRHDFDILLNALVTADLVDALASRSFYGTLFAPTDAAFIRTAQDLGFTGTDEAGAWQFLVTALTGLGGGDPVPVLTNILLYHVSPRSFTSAWINYFDFFDRPIPTLLSGATITPDNGSLIDNDPDITDPRLTAPRNIFSRNGIIQAVDRVLIPVDL